MGCDIHASLEVKIGDKWHHFSTVHIRRNYDLFSRMCPIDGRGECHPIADERPFPSDLSMVGKMLMDNEDYHTFSYLDEHELDQLINWCNAQDGNWLIIESLVYCIEDAIWLKESHFISSYRLIFAFDN